MKFQYQARSQDGSVQEGTIEASSKENALNLLRRKAVYVTYLQESGKGPFWTRQLEFFQHIKLKDVVMFTRQLAIMFTSSVSLVESLRAIGRQTSNKQFAEIIVKLAESVEGGSQLSGALEEYPDVFSPFYVNMIKSGEASGELSEILERLADHLEREYNLTSKVKGAMIYPAFVVVMAVIVLALMTFFVMPNISRVIQETGQELPLITRIILGASDAFRSWAWVPALFLIGAGIALFQYRKTSKGKAMFDRWLLSVPLVSSFLRMVYLSRFAESLSTLVAAGVPIAESLRISSEVVGNEQYKEIIMAARDGVQRGDRMSSVLSLHPKDIPAIFAQMLEAGEQSGSVDKTLSNVSRFYEQEIQRGVDTFLSLLEPVLIVGLGVFVGIVMAAVLIPLYQISSLQ
ncbi:MAG: type II secretion system F family protein [bacterium]|nr:type II secretion system F family protein [bacterium]